jgi:hypothetical protein
LNEAPEPVFLELLPAFWELAAPHAARLLLHHYSELERLPASLVFSRWPELSLCSWASRQLAGQYISWLKKFTRPSLAE